MIKENKNIIIGVAIIIVILIAISLFSNKNGAVAPTIEEIGKIINNEKAPATNETQTATTPAKTSASAPVKTSPTPAVTVSYINGPYTTEFSPRTAVIYKGQTVLFVNNSKETMWVISDPHPEHSSYPAFNQGRAVAPGGTYSKTFNEIGDWYYHNEASPVRTGRIIVKSL